MLNLPDDTPSHGSADAATRRAATAWTTPLDALSVGRAERRRSDEHRGRIWRALRGHVPRDDGRAEDAERAAQPAPRRARRDLRRARPHRTYGSDARFGVQAARRRRP